MNAFSKLSLAAVTLALALPAAAGTAKVSFANVDDYTDFEPASGITERFQKSKMDALTAYFNQLSEQLPEDQQLTVTVKDIDLTGRLEPTFGESTSQFIRVVRSIDFPTMTLDYQLTDGQGTVIKSAESVKLKDMGFDFNTTATTRMRTDDLYYEQKMLKDWFRETFSAQLSAGKSANPPAESA